MAINKVLGFDFGTRRIGVATGQTITKTASPLSIIQAKDGIPNWDEIKKIIIEWRPDALIVGLPLNMDGTEQDITKLARKFGQRLHGRFGLEVIFIDERLSSKAAKWELLDDTEPKKPKDMKRIDAYAACLIVESWLD